MSFIEKWLKSASLQVQEYVRLTRAAFHGVVTAPRYGHDIVEQFEAIGVGGGGRPRTVDVTMAINKRSRDRITTGSTATLGSVSLLGESAVDITPSTEGTPISEWGYVPQGRSRGQISDIAEQASQGVEEVSKLVRDVREGKGTLGGTVAERQAIV